VAGLDNKRMRRVKSASAYEMLDDTERKSKDKRLMDPGAKELTPKQVIPMDEEDFKLLEKSIREFTWYFDGFDHQEILDAPFTKLIPVHKRPYGKLYAY